MKMEFTSFPDAEPVKPAKAGFMRSIFPGVSKKDVETFYFQLATMLGSGVAIRDALHTLAESLSPSASGTIARLAERVGEGSLLSEAMAERPEIFRSFDLAMVKTGELTGRLDENLHVLGELLAVHRRIRSKAVTSLIYPIFLLHIGVVLLNAHLYFMAGEWALLKAVGKTLVPIYAVVLTGFVLHRLWRDRHTYGNFLLSLPGLGPLLGKMALARASRAIASLYEAGVPLPQALLVAAEAAGNGAIRETFARASRTLDAGDDLTTALSHSPLIPPMVKDMIRTGEHSGSLGQSLFKVAEYYEEESETTLTRVAKMGPVIIYLVILCALGYQVIRFWTELYGTIGDLAG